MVLVAPPTLLPVGVADWPVTVSHDLDAELPVADAVLMLRVQAERMNGGFFPSAREYSVLYGLSEKRQALLPGHAVVLHPGPMLRGMEIASSVADSSQSAVLQQVSNGVHVRMAVLFQLLVGAGAAASRMSASAHRPRAVLIRGVRLYGEGDPVDVLVADGQIAEIGADLAVPDDADVIDATGQVLLPGFVDLHTHLREPGREYAETSKPVRRQRLSAATPRSSRWPTPTRSPTAPVVTDHVWHRGQQVGLVDVHPVGAVTVGLAGKQLTEMGMMAAGAGQVRMFSDDGICVDDPLVMRRALEYATGLGVLIAQHAEEPRLTVGAVAHEGPNAARLGLAGWPRAAEESIVARDALLARDAGARVHICHASTAGTVEIIRWAKEQGISITAEVTPHHLLLDDTRLATYDGRNRVNPPLREATDAEALRQALADGVIDCVATDHAPHAEHEKCCEFAAARPGMLGLQTALSVVVETMVRPGLLTWRDVARVMSESPAAHRRTARPGPPAGGRRAGQPDRRRPRRDLDGRGCRPGEPLGQHPVRVDGAARGGDADAAARQGHRARREESGA